MSSLALGSALGITSLRVGDMNIPPLRMRKLSLRVRVEQEQTDEDAETRRGKEKEEEGGRPRPGAAPQLCGPCRKCSGSGRGASPGPKTQPQAA